MKPNHTRKKALIHMIKGIRIEEVKVSKPEPEVIYMNESPIGSRQSKFIEIRIIGYEK